MPTERVREAIDGLRIDDLHRLLTVGSAPPARVVSPVTGETLHEIPQATAADVAAAAGPARDAGRRWWEAGPRHRREVLLRAHDALYAQRSRLIDAIQLETGKTRGGAYEEFFNAAAAIRYAALSAPRAVRSERRRAGIPLVMRARVEYAPRGLVGVVTPWNYPPSLTAMDVAPALATGNAVLQKVDEQGALSSLIVREAFAEAGLPPEVWTVVAGPGAEIGDALVDAVDYVCFTGSTATGRHVAERAASRLIDCSLELGGKNAVLVLDDVDIDHAAAVTASACFSGAGQLCVSAERVIVDEAIAERFVPAFVARVAALRLGTGIDGSTDMGSLATARQLERVTAHVDDARAQGARVLTGGRPRPDAGPYVYEPTVLADVPPDALCAREETFGPVVSVFTVRGEEAAIAEADFAGLGLSAGVLSGSTTRARRVASRLAAGSVNLGEGYRATFSALDAPMGGWRSSGLGPPRNGPEGLARFLEPRTIGWTTGLMKLPLVAEDFARLGPVMNVLLRANRVLRRR